MNEQAIFGNVAAATSLDGKQVPFQQGPTMVLGKEYDFYKHT